MKTKDIPQRLAICALGVAILGILSGVTRAAEAPQTERKFLSGEGPADAVPWEFSVTGGRRANEWTTLPVPSLWEQQGFGTYNYGDEREPKADEHGLYRMRFTTPSEWKDRRVRIVFEGSMTDTAVKVNGQFAGPLHQGAFYRFSYDITKLLKSAGEANLLEVDVAKASSAPDTDKAERQSDYWVFGGIFRPVYLEAVPAQSIWPPSTLWPTRSEKIRGRFYGVQDRATR